jgi:hypothetical protein
VTTILAIDVAAIDADGIRVPDGCRQANNTMPVDQAFDRSIRAALSGAVLTGRSPAPVCRRRSRMQCKTLWLVIWPQSGTAPCPRTTTP